MKNYIFMGYAPIVSGVVLQNNLFQGAVFIKIAGQLKLFFESAAIGIIIESRKYIESRAVCPSQRPVSKEKGKGWRMMGVFDGKNVPGKYNDPVKISGLPDIPQMDQERIRDLFLEFTSEIFLFLDADMRVLWANRASAEAVGLSDELMKGFHCYELWHQRTSPCRGCPLVGVLESGDPCQSEIRDEGGRVWLLRGYPIKDMEGNIINLIEHGTDITARKRAEEQERHMKAVLRTMRHIDQIIIAEKDELNLIGKVCNTLTDTMGYFNALVALFDDNRLVTSAAGAGMEKRMSFFEEKFSRGELPSCMLKAMDYPDLWVTGDCLDDCSGCDFSWKGSGCSGFTIALSFEDRLYGVMSVSLSPEYSALPEERELFREMSGDVSRALRNMEIDRERLEAESLAAETQRDYQKRIAESEDKYRTAFKTSFDSITINDMEGRYVDVNDAFTRLSGFSEDEVIGRRPSEINLWAREEDRTKLLNEIRNMGFLNNLDVLIRNRDGSMSTGLMSASVIRLNNEPHMLTITKDITDRKKAQVALEESERRFRSLFENNYACMLIVDPQNGLIVDANPAAEKHFGRAISELKSMTVFDIDASSVDHVWSRIHGAHSGEKNHFYTKHSLGDGSIRDEEVYSGAIRINDRDYLFSIIHDISDSVRAEARIQSLLAEKEIFLREVHHRIKNNMSTMMSLLALQADMQKDPVAGSILIDARNRMQGMMVLYEKLYRSERIGQKMSVRDYIPHLVDEIVSMFQDKPMVKVAKDVDDFQLDVSLMAPLGIIMNELITNSMKHAFDGMKEGRISVKAEKESGMAVITVGDNGRGFPDEFFSEKDSGFGLQLVKLLARQLNGSIERQRREGTVLVLRFPA
jgi:PAS domain S-box-containing protein